MKKESLMIFLLFWTSHPPKARAIAALRPQVESSTICWQSFETPLPFQESIYSRLPSLRDSKSPLPEQTKKRILSHPKVKELKALHKKGEGLTFDFSYLGHNSLHRGEYIQRVFLIKILRFLFPKAKIIVRSYKTRFDSLYPFRQAGKTNVSLDIQDVREYTDLTDEMDLERHLSIHKNIVDMVLLKMANGSQKEISADYKKSFPTFNKKHSPFPLSARKTFALHLQR